MKKKHFIYYILKFGYSLFVHHKAHLTYAMNQRSLICIVTFCVRIHVSRLPQFGPLRHRNIETRKKTDILPWICNPGSRIWKDISSFQYCASHPIKEKKLAYGALGIYHWQSVTKLWCAIAHHILPELILKCKTPKGKSNSLYKWLNMQELWDKNNRTRHLK